MSGRRTVGAMQARSQDHGPIRRRFGADATSEIVLWSRVRSPALRARTGEMFPDGGGAAARSGDAGYDALRADDAGREISSRTRIRRCGGVAEMARTRSPQCQRNLACCAPIGGFAVDELERVHGS